MTYDEHGFDEEAWARVVLERRHAYTADQIREARKILGVAGPEDRADAAPSDGGRED